jgi:hypothetical protein
MRTFAQKPKATQQTTPSKSTIPGRAYFGQSRERELDSILHLQRTIGNQAVRRLLEANSENIKGQDSSITAIARFGHDFSRIPIHPPAAGPIQTKLAINRSGDEYEQEADRIAAQVLASPAPSAVSGAPPRIQRFSGQSTGHLDAAPASVDQALASPGRPLEPGLRKDMEQRFAQDFSGVRVHSNGAAEQSVREAGAMAYTTGENIVFGAGQYAPGTAEGKRLLAHELTHVVQQRGGMGERLQRAPGGAPTAPVKALEPLEAVAQRIARLATGPSSATVNLKGGPGKVVSVIRNVRTGQISVGLNTGIPAAATQPIRAAIEAQMQRIAAGEVAVVHTAAYAVGGHAEVNALNRAIAAEQAALGRVLTAEEIAATFEMHNVWLSGRRRLTTAPRCEHCAAITRGLRVTESLFKAEGGTPKPPSLPAAAKPPTTAATEPPVAPAKVPPATPQVPAQKTEVQKPQPSQVEPKVTVTPGTSRTGPTPEIARTAFAIEPLPAKAQARGNVLGAGAQALNARLLGNLRGAEAAKAQERYEELLREAEPLRWQGNTVVIKAVMEVPNNVDPFANATGVGDQSHVVYFISMDIVDVLNQRRADVSSPPTMRAYSGDLKQEDELTFAQQLEELDWTEKGPVRRKKRPRGPGFHYETDEQRLEPFDIPEARMVIGARVPATARTYPVPAWIAEEFPSLRTYSVIAEGRKMGFVDPNTNEIKLIIDVPFQQP